MQPISVVFGQAPGGGTNPANPTGNTAALLNDLGLGSGKVINTVSDFIGTLADASGAVGGIFSLVSALGSIGQPDPLQEILTALQNIQSEITTDFQQLEAGVTEDDLLTRNSNVQTAIAPALSSLQLVKDYIGASVTREQALNQIEPCLTTLNTLTFTEDSYWYLSAHWLQNLSFYWSDKGLFQGTCYYATLSGGGGRAPSPEVVTSDVGYGQQLPPTTADGAVFNYIYILPSYLYAISIFIGVAGSYIANFAQDPDLGPILQSSVAQLQTIHNLIRDNGIKQLLPPNWSTNGPLGLACNPSTLTSSRGIRLTYTGSGYDPSNALIEYGAVDLFSGFGSVDGEYQIQAANGGNISTVLATGTYDSITYRKMLVRAMKRQKDVYVGIGLKTVWDTINRLLVMLGQPQMPGPAFSDWSFRQVFQVSQFPAIGSGLSLRSLAYFIMAADPADTPYNSSTSGGVGLFITISMRAILTQFPTTFP
jgi:hypothetical protein